MRRVHIPLLVLLLGVLPVQAGVYTWVDASGVRHFSDQPVPGSEQVEVVPQNVYTPPAPPATDASATQAVKPGGGFHYDSIQIQFPEDGSTIRENTGRIEVQVDIRPPLQSARGDRLSVVLDGAVEQTATGSRLVFDNVPRGEHQLVARILDGRGEVLAESPPVTFYLHRYSALFERGSENSDSDNAAPRLRRAPMMPRAPQAPRFPASR